ncbi:MAG TPA: SMI1/KNR4 family protein [Sandaracinaceae bacterium LLY-WYZ-13_1]|nr:SMI1/KNR4 family protein [Sandaracinaceae bacterium LLY-WYZ-13_1]
MTTEDALARELRERIDAYWAAHRAACRLPSKAPDYDVEDGGVPKAMELGEPDADGWVGWRVVDSPVTAAELDALEARVGPLPTALRAHLRAACQLLELRLDGTNVALPQVPSDDPLGPVEAALTSWPPLAQLGFVPFGSYADGAGPICFDRERPTGDRDERDFTVVWFDHDALHSSSPDAWADRAAVEALARPLAPSCRELFLRCLG